MGPSPDERRSAPRVRVFLTRAALVLAALCIAELAARIFTRHDTERARVAIVEGGAAGARRP